MAVTTYRINNDYNASNHMEFLLDGDSSIKDLPRLETCSAGSVALTDSGEVFFLMASGEWKNPFADKDGG